MSRATFLYRRNLNLKYDAIMREHQADYWPLVERLMKQGENAEQIQRAVVEAHTDGR